MSDPATPLMTAEAFIAWSMEQPDGDRYELVAGNVVRMAAERAAHARAKLRIAVLMSAAIRSGKLPCEVFADGMSVLVDDLTIYEPDAQLRCGSRLPDNAVKVLDPLIVVEVVSPSSRAVDSGAKLADYFRIPSLRHYLIVRTESRTIIRHTRDGSGTILTSILRDGVVTLDPPGITLTGVFDD